MSITVADTGKRIPPELMERICEPFFSTHQEEGLRGLGLAIVQDIVKMHGGAWRSEASRAKEQRSSSVSPRREYGDKDSF